MRLKKFLTQFLLKESKISFMDMHLGIAEHLVNVLENRFKIFGFRFGLEPVLGLFPIFGDIATLLISLYIVWIGIQMKLPADKISQMMGNVLFDFLIGLIPFFGDIGDFIFRANAKNLEIIKAHRAQIINGELVSTS